MADGDTGAARGAGTGHGLPFVVGVVAPDGRPWGPDLCRRSLWVVAGPARSGRSTALDVLAGQALAAGVPVVRLDHESTAGSEPRGPDAPAAACPSNGALTTLLLVDDVERLSAAAMVDLERWLADRTGPLRDVLGPEAATVLAGSSEWFAGEFRGVPALVRRHGQGVVLHAGRTDSRDVLGVRSPLQQRTRVPGRGLLVDRGVVRRIQLLLPDTETSVPAAAGPLLS